MKEQTDRGEGVEKKWSDMRDKIKETLERMEKEKGRLKRRWWDKESRDSKKTMKRELRKSRKEKEIEKDTKKKGRGTKIHVI